VQHKRIGTPNFPNLISTIFSLLKQRLGGARRPDFVVESFDSMDSETLVSRSPDSMRITL